MSETAVVPTTATPPLRYLGSKWRLADWVIGHFPPHKIYVEPFAGGAAVFFRKRRTAIEVINDLDGEVVNFFRVLRKHCAELVEQISLTPWSRDEYMLSLQPAPETDVIERARRFYTALHQGFGSTLTYNSGWRRRLTGDIHAPLVDMWRRKQGLLMAADRLKDAMIENRPALDVIRNYDSVDTLFYVDPPYVVSSRGDKGRRRYRVEMEDKDHRELAEVLRSVEGMVVISGYECDLYDELYGDWVRVEKTTTTNGNNNAIESLWLNPSVSDMNKLPLFAGIK